jgi:hypothetical protein
VAAAVTAAITAAAIAAAGAALVGCGREVQPPGATPGARAPRLSRRVDPAELFPADLDLVVRVDVDRMRSGLGPAATDELTERALARRTGSGAGERASPAGGGGDGAGDDAALRDALRRADVVWVALRLADLDAGDRVIAFEGRMRGVDRDPSAWQPLPVDVAGVSVFARRGHAGRAGVARMIALGDHAVAFVSPVEVASVARVLRDGPDERRGDPSAEGLVSLDLRARRLPPRLERRFPSIAALIAGLERVRAVASLAEEGVRVEADVVGRTPDGAGRARRFLEALRDNVGDPSYAEVMKALSIEQVERTVRIRWTLPSRVVLTLLASEDPG